MCTAEMGSSPNWWLTAPAIHPHVVSQISPCEPSWEHPPSFSRQRQQALCCEKSSHYIVAKTTRDGQHIESLYLGAALLLHCNLDESLTLS